MSNEARYRRRLRTDWFRLLADLQQRDYPNARVASILDVPPSTLRGWKAGGEPAHADGNNLIELWCEVTARTHGDRPMTWD